MEPFKLAPTPVTLPEYFAFKEFTPKNPEQGVRYFHSVIKPWRPFSSPGTFGGFCLSQGALCAAYTCPKGFVVHNQHSYFLLPGRWDVPFLWRVESVRDGRSYCTREVKAYQPDLGFEFPESPYQQPSDFDFTDPASKKWLAYTAHSSIKLPHKDTMFHEKKLRQDFFAKNVPGGAEGHDLAPDIDIPMWVDWSKDPANGYKLEPHPIEMRKVDMDKVLPAVNKGKDVAERRQLYFFRVPYKLPDDMNYHVAAMLYLSDRNSLFTCMNLRDKVPTLARLASLDHQFTMHDMHSRVDEGWMPMETWTDWAGDCRGQYQGRLFTDEGKLVCTFMQDGLIRTVEEDHDDDDDKKEDDKADNTTRQVPRRIKKKTPAQNLFLKFKAVL